MFLVALLSLFVFVYSLIQILTFYNIQINFFALYVSFYTFMTICVWMFSEPAIDSVSKIKGMLVEITGESGKTVRKIFSDSGIDMEMDTAMDSKIDPE